MNKHWPSLKRTAAAAFLACFILLPASGAQAQRPGDRPRIDPQQTVIDQGLREMQVRSLEMAKEARGATLTTASPEVIKLVKEDFGRIQEINGKIISSYTRGDAPDYGYLSEAMAEINKRAARLNTNLLLPQLTKHEVLQPAEGSPLIQLNDLIQHFVTNALFQNAGTIDAGLGVAARRDLENIIELSDRIRKSADRLQKSGSKNKVKAGGCF